MDTGRWYYRHRMEWIAETLRVFGFINRCHIMRKFGLSQPQASADLKAFAREHNGAMSYDLIAKCYISVNNKQAKRHRHGC